MKLFCELSMTKLHNPTLKNLVRFLRLVRQMRRTYLLELGKAMNADFTSASRYLKYCNELELVEKIGEKLQRGNRRAKLYELSPKGEQFLEIFEGKLCESLSSVREKDNV